MISASEASTVLDRIGALQDEVIDTVVRAVRIPSVNPSYPGQSYDDVVGGEADVARLLAEQYRSCGATIDTFAVAPGRENAVGVVEGTGGGRSLILNGHVDVVPPGALEDWKNGDPFSGHVQDGRVHGRGTTDMKAGLIAMAFAARALHEAGVRLRGDLILQAVAAEESLEHTLGTTAVLERGYRADAAIVGEPTGWGAPLSVMPTEPGLLGLAVEVNGKASHASMRGEVVHGSSTGEPVAVSAIDKAFLIYEALRRLEVEWGRTKSDPLFPPGHFAISPAVFSGGKRHVPSPAYIPDQASLVYAVFYPPAETADTVRAEIESCIAAVAASDPWLAEHPPQLVWPIAVPPSSLSSQHPLTETLLRARQIGCEGLAQTDQPLIRGLPSVCDMTWLAAAGIPSLAFGPGTLRLAHADNESCSIEEIMCATRTYAMAALDWCR